MSLNPPPRSTDRPSTALNPLKALTAENPSGKAVGNINPYLPRPADGNGLAEGLAQVANALGHKVQQQNAEKVRQQTALEAKRDSLTLANRALEFNTELRDLSSTVQDKYKDDPDGGVKFFDEQAAALALKHSEGLPEPLQLDFQKAAITSQISEGGQLGNWRETQKNKNVQVQTQAVLQGAAQQMGTISTSNEMFKSLLAIRAHTAELGNVLGSAAAAPMGKAAEEQGILNTATNMARTPEGLEELLGMIEGKVTFKTGIQNEDGTEQELKITDFIDASRLNAIYNGGKNDQQAREAEQKRQQTLEDSIAFANTRGALALGVQTGTTTQAGIAKEKQNAKTPAELNSLNQIEQALQRVQKHAEDAKIKGREKAAEAGLRTYRADRKGEATHAVETLRSNQQLAKAVKSKDWDTAEKIYSQAATSVAVAVATGSLDPNAGYRLLGQLNARVQKDILHGRKKVSKRDAPVYYDIPMQLEKTYKARIAVLGGGSDMAETATGRVYRDMQKMEDAGKPALTETQLGRLYNHYMNAEISRRLRGK